MTADSPEEFQDRLGQLLMTRGVTAMLDAARGGDDSGYQLHPESIDTIQGVLRFLVASIIKGRVIEGGCASSETFVDLLPPHPLYSQPRTAGRDDNPYRNLPFYLTWADPV